MFLRLFWNPEQKRLAMVWRLILQLILMFLLALPLGLLQFLLMQSGIQLDSGILTILSITSGLITLLGFLGSIYFTGRWFDRRKFADFGLHFSRNWWTDLGFGLLLGAALMALIFLVEYSLGWVTITGTLQKGLMQPSFWGPFFLQLFLFINVGIYEELFSRGFHLKNLAEGFNVFKAISPRTAILISVFLSSAIFGLLHAGNPNATWVSSFNIFLAGIFLAIGFLLTGELAIPIGIHITWNFFQGNVFGFPVSGTDAGATLVGIEQGGPAVLTGGPFGPEAGLIGIAAIILGSALTYWYVKLRYGKADLWEKLTVPDFLPKHQAKLDAAAAQEEAELPAPDHEIIDAPEE